MKKAKIEMETLGKILLLTAFLIIFLLMFKGCKDQMENVGIVGTNEYICWFSHTLKGQITFLFPSACYPIDIDKEQDKKGISILMRKCWWMHGQGEEDIVTGETNLGVLAKKGISWYDIARTCYIFTPKEDIPIQDFLTYLRNYDKSGKEIKKEEDSKKTTWGYIQKTSTEETGVCLDKRIDVMSNGTMYYIIFYDDRGPISNGARDKIMISRDPEFGADQTGFFGWLDNIFNKLKKFVKMESLKYEEYCYDVEEELEKKQEEFQEKFKAVTFFNEMIKTLQRCVKITGKQPCICDDSTLDPHNKFSRDYSIKFEKIGEKKYKISLLDKNKKVYEEDGKEFIETIEGNRLGSWADREMARRDLVRIECLPGVINKDYEITKYLKDYYILYHPNSEYARCLIGTEFHNPKEEDFSATYLVQKELTGFKKCSEIR